MVGQIEDLNQTKLFQDLKRRSKREPLAREYHASILTSFGQLHKYLDEIRRYFSHFTDHCVTHSIRIINRISSFLSRDQIRGLTSSEIYLMISAALVHDIGMVLSESEAEAIWLSGDFQQDYGRLIKENFTAGPNPGTINWQRAGIGRFLLADFVRRKHGDRALLTVESECLPISLLSAGSRDRAECIGLIARAHTLDFDFVASERNLPTDRLLDEQRVNLRFLAICLRIGDLLDINTSRVCPVIRHLSEPLPYISKAHWDQYHRIILHEPRYGADIVVSGTCPTQDSHRLLKEWLRSLSAEVGNAVALLNTTALRDSQYHLRIGRVIDQVEPETDCNGLPKYEFLEYRFNLDEERVFERLFGERLYGRIDLALRELLQNAIDATRYRIAHQLNKRTRRDNNGSRHRSLCRAIARHGERFAINVSLYRRSSADPIEEISEHTYLSIEDSGIGMSRETISDYLLKVGRSRWREDPLVKDFNVREIGEFGIGFLSTFMIADMITIETKSALPNEPAVKVTIKSWNGYISTEPSLKESAGTRVEMRLKPRAVAEFANIFEIFSRWCPLLELPVVVSAVDGSQRLFPPRGLSYPTEDIRGKSQNRIFFPLSNNEFGSYVTVATRPDGFAGGRSFCQDGLTVADVPPPLRQIPQHIALKEANVCVDLRGSDRLPLDLSRNLIRGDSRKVWDRLAPSIWSGLISSGALVSSAARLLIDKYVVLEYAAFERDARIYASHDRKLRPLSSLLTRDDPVVGFVDTSDPQSSSYLAEQAISWVFVPDPNVVQAADYEDRKVIARIKKAARHATTRMSKVFSQGVDSDEFLPSLTPPMSTLGPLFLNIPSVYPFIYCSPKTGKTVFSRLENSECMPVRRMGFIFPCENAAMIRGVSLDKWLLVPRAYYDDLIQTARRFGFS